MRFDAKIAAMQSAAEFGKPYGVPGWMQMRDIDIETGAGLSNRIHVGMA
jgi:hypothetical protein